MDVVDPLRFLFAFIFVLGLIGVLAVCLRYYKGSRFVNGGMQSDGRLRIMETQYIDPKRKLVLVRCDNKEYILLLADGREIVVESGIEVKDAS